LNQEKLIEYLQLDLAEMPLRKGEVLYSKILLNVGGVLHTIFIKYHFALDAYGRKGFRAIGIGLKGKKIKNWEELPNLAKLYLTNAQHILSDSHHPMYEIVESSDFDKYVTSFGYSLYERQVQNLEQRAESVN